MAGVGFWANATEVLTGTAVKTILQLVAAANHRLHVNTLSISFKGTSPTDAPVLVEICRQTGAGTSSANTPVKECSADTETLQVTARDAFLAEPASSTVLWSEEVHPQSGLHVIQRALNDIPVVGGERLGVRVTAAVTVKVVVTLRGKE